VKFVSPALRHIVFPALSRTGYLRHNLGAGPAVVTYHGVFPEGYKVRDSTLDGNLVRADSLRRQLDLLKKRYHVITPEDFLQWSDGQRSLPPRSVLLTCDDALENTLTEMLPILKDSGLSCLFFATGASAEETPSMLWYEEIYRMLLDVDGPASLDIAEAGISIDRITPNEKHAGWWKLVKQLSPFDGKARRRLLDGIRRQLGLADCWAARLLEDKAVAGRFRVLDRTGLRQLAAAGMTIGAHSLSHPVLACLPDDLAGREISEGKRVLEKTLDRAVWAFAYPFGNADTVTRRDIRLAERAGFRCGFMNVGGGFGAEVAGSNGTAAESRRFALPRVHVTADMNLAEFEAHISGFYRSMRRRLLGEDELNAVVGA